MTPLDENTLSPFQIGDAREAAHRASELQREVEDEIRARSREAANAERRYRVALSVKMLELAAGVPGDDEGWAVKPIAATVTKDLARGDQTVANLKHEAAVAAGLLEAARQHAFRVGADRRDLAALIDWSMRRDLRTDTPPDQFEQAIGGRRA